jgi:hypothetical protein
VFVCLVAKLNDRFLEKRININILVKLSLEMKHGALNTTRKQAKNFPLQTADTSTTQGSSHVEITKEDNAYHFLRYQGYCSL